MLKHILWLILVLYPHSAQAQEDIQLQIRLRHSDGTAAAGETIILERLPEEEPVPWTAQDNALRQAQGDTLRQAQDNACTTDANGECSWSVMPGLYQVLFTRPLDDLSALAVAEGGLSGFGLTVGDDDITYHFTFHSDSRVYFDAAPDSAVPSPIIPDADDIHDWTGPTPAGTAESGGPAVATTTPSVVVTPTQGPESGRSWRPLLFIVLGLILGGGLHFLRRGSGQALRQRSGQAGLQNHQQKDHPTTRLKDHPTKRLKDHPTKRPDDGGTTHA